MQTLYVEIYSLKQEIIWRAKRAYLAQINKWKITVSTLYALLTNYKFY